MKILHRLKQRRKDICMVIGVLAFLALSGAVPENPKGLVQGIIAIALIAMCVIVGTWGENLN
jgi:hypothetical protein